MSRNDANPWEIFDRGDGTYSLGFDDFDSTADVFEEMGYEGGGCGWHGVVDALVRRKVPRLARNLEYDPEGSLFAALSDDPNALNEVAVLIRNALDDPALLRQALENADPDLMD
jgi:hypothetical protein